jgi:hypothetical protein
MLKQQAFFLGYLGKEAGSLQAVNLKPSSPQKHKIFSEDVLRYIQNEFLPQAENFIKYGRNPKLPGYHPMWDYGGNGSAGKTEQQRLLYEKMAQQLATQIYKETKKNPRLFADRWHGNDAAGNALYWKGVLKHLTGVKNPDYTTLMSAIRKNETGQYKDPWVRSQSTGKTSSTAYGPYQITKTLVEDYLKRFSK